MSETIGNEPEIVAEQKELNFAQRIIGMIFAPTETMNDLGKKPRIVFPFIAPALSIMILYGLQYPLFVKMIRENIERSMAKQPQQITGASLDSIVDWSAKIGLFTAPVGAIFGWLMIAGIVFGAVKILGGQGGFKQYMSVTGYASITTVIFILLSLGISYVTGELMLDASLAILVPNMKGTFLYGALKSFDFFGIWHFCLIGIGIETVSKLSKAKSYGIVAAGFIVTVIIGGVAGKFS